MKSASNFIQRETSILYMWCAGLVTSTKFLWKINNTESQLKSSQTFAEVTVHKLLPLTIISSRMWANLKNKKQTKRGKIKFSQSENLISCFNEQESRRSLWCSSSRICNFEWAHTRLLWPSVTCATLSWKQVFIPHHHSKVDQSADTPQHVFSLPVGGPDSLSSVKSCSQFRSECTPAYALQK